MRFVSDDQRKAMFAGGGYSGGGSKPRSGAGGGKTPRPRAPFSYPNFPVINVTVHPSYVPWLPGGQAWADIQNGSVLTQGFGNATTGNNIIQYWTTVDWTDYFHKPTKSVEPTRSPGSTGPTWTSFFQPNQAEAQYYATAERAGITNPPPPNWGGAAADFRTEIWNMFNSPTYWDLDPSND